MVRRYSRRQILMTGAKAAGLAAFGWPYRGSLRADDTSAPFLLMVHCSGGWDPTMVFDSKIDVPTVAQETGAILASGSADIPFIDHPNRPAVKAFFAAEGANAVIINGLFVGSVVREEAAKKVLGIVPQKGSRHVDWLTYYAYSLNPALTIPHAVIGAPFMPGAYSSVSANLDHRYLSHLGQPLPAADSIGTKGEEALAAFRSATFSLFSKKAIADSLDDQKISALASSYSRAPTIDATVTEALATLGPQGTDSNLLRDGKLALELFANGHSLCASIQAGDDDEWCTTENHFEMQTNLYQNLFADLSSLIAYAATKNIDKQLIVIVTSERGRSPSLNDSGGKDAWPYTSALFWSQNRLNGGHVIGKTDAVMRGVKMNPLFGDSTGKDDVLIEMGHVFSALYLITGVRTSSIVPTHKPLAVILPS